MYDSKPGIKTEDVLIRYCARTDIDVNWRLKIKKILSPDLDWAYFFEKAHNELLAPLMYKTFLTIEGAKGLVPDDIWQRLKDEYYFTLGNNIVHSAQLEKVITGFREQNIQALIFKGLMLSELVYRDMGLRPSGDFDILVKTQDIPRVDNILRGLNYHGPSHIKDFGNIRINDYRNSLFYLNREENYAPVHIYWHPVNFTPYNKNIFRHINMDKIWKEARPIKLDGIALLTFSAYHQIIYLSMHALSHFFYPLILLCDINELLRSEAGRLDWDKLVYESSRFGLSKHVYYTLYFSLELLQANIPPDIIDKLRPARTSLFEQRLIPLVLERKPILDWAWLVYFGMNENLKDRLLFLIRVALPTRAELALIRQKDISQVNIFDYIRRFNSGLNSAAKALLSRFI